MRTISEYVFSVCGAALLCAVMSPFFKRGSAAGIGKIVTGMVVLLTVLQPLMGFALPALDDITVDFRTDAQQAIASGEKNTQQALSKIITDRTTEYILQKAEALGLQIEVQVVVSEDAIPMPKTVFISGTAAPYARQQLQDMIRRDLGIAKENQIWT